MSRTVVVAATLMTIAIGGSAFSHCEIPCGIYGDSARYDMLEEHITTIEKSMDQIAVLSQGSSDDNNQLIRWVMNKEDHANQFQEIVSQYFLNQRVKPQDSSDTESYQKYLKHLELFHRMLVEAMKCKQSIDKSHIQTLRELVSASRELYFGEHAH